MGKIPRLCPSKRNNIVSSPARRNNVKKEEELEAVTKIEIVPEARIDGVEVKLEAVEREDGTTEEFRRREVEGGKREEEVVVSW